MEKKCVEIMSIVCEWKIGAGEVISGAKVLWEDSMKERRLA